MATGPTFSTSRRRSSRGISLLPSQDHFVKDLPVGIPEEDRLRILFRLCFKQSLSVLSEDLDGFEDLHRKLLVQGLSLFDRSDDDSDRLDMLLKLTTSKTDTTDVVPAAVGAIHHEQLKSLVAECKRWNELLAEDVQCEPETPLVDDDEAKMPAARQRHYDMLLEGAERSRRRAFALFSELQAVADEADPSVADQKPGDSTASEAEPSKAERTVGDSTASLFEV